VSATQLFSAIFNAAIAVAIIGTVLSLGMSFTVNEILAPLRRWILVLSLVALNCLLIPAAAWGIFKLFGMQDAYVSGATLVVIGAAGASGLKAAQISKRADLATAVSIVIVLQLVNLAAVPLWAGRVVTGASISSGTILKNLLELVLVPLAIGLFVRARYADHAAEWKPGLDRVSNLAMGVGLVVGIAVNWHTIVSLLGSRVLVASIVVSAVATGAGFLAGGRSAPTRTTAGIISGMRFGSLGLIIIGTQLNGNPDYLGPAILFALVDMIVVMFVAVEIGRKAATHESVVAESSAAPALT
jgi:BASS family bile acid:Na+ symporter